MTRIDAKERPDLGRVVGGHGIQPKPMNCYPSQTTLLPDTDTGWTDSGQWEAEVKKTAAPPADQYHPSLPLLEITSQHKGGGLSFVFKVCAFCVASCSCSVLSTSRCVVLCARNDQIYIWRNDFFLLFFSRIWWTTYHLINCAMPTQLYHCLGVLPITECGYAIMFSRRVHHPRLELWTSCTGLQVSHLSPPYKSTGACCIIRAGGWSTSSTYSRRDSTL